MLAWGVLGPSLAVAWTGGRCDGWGMWMRALYESVAVLLLVAVACLRRGAGAGVGGLPAVDERSVLRRADGGGDEVELFWRSYSAVVFLGCAVL